MREISSIRFKVAYNKLAADFYLRLLQCIQSPNASYGINLGCAYHLHEAKRYEESYTHNKALAEFATKIGDSDRAEKCYRTAIESAKKLNRDDDEKSVFLT